VANDGAVVAFAAAINGVNLLRSYNLYICVDVPVGYVGIPSVEYQLAVVKFEMQQSVTGTVIFTSKMSDAGVPRQARASYKNSVPIPYQPIAAYATWTNLTPGASVSRDQIVSLYLDNKIGNEEASFQVFLLASNF
jgi:hypothetical protein